MATRPLSADELLEVDHLAAECESHPHRLRCAMAELMRLRQFAETARDARRALPQPVRACLDLNVPTTSATLELALAEADGRTVDATPVQGVLL